MKKIIMVLFIAIGMIMGGMFLSQKADAASYAYSCVVPYNIKSGNWTTGLHITANYYASEEFTITFVDSTGTNKTVYLDLADYPGGWTGTVDQLFSLPTLLSRDPEVNYMPPVKILFRSPSTLLIHSNLGYFMVTQFVVNSVSGFGFQTFYSWPYGSWPHYGAPIMMP